MFREVPFATVGGAAGFDHIETVASKSPTNGSSALCCWPGVIAFIIASIAAFCSGDMFSILCSWARAAVNTPRTRRAVVNKIFIRMSSLQSISRTATV